MAAPIAWVGVLLALVALSMGDAPFRLPNSPYPAPRAGPNCAREIFAFDDTLLNQTQLLTLETLQGLLARTCPQLYRLGSGAVDDMASLWASRFPKFGASVNYSLKGNFLGLVQRFAPRLQGYVLCSAPKFAEKWTSMQAMFAKTISPHLSSNTTTTTATTADSSCAVAIALASSNLSLIAVTTDNELAIQSLGLRRLYDARTMTYADVLKIFTIGSTFNSHIAILQDPSKFTFLADYGTFSQGFTFWDDSGPLISPLSKAVLGALQLPAAVLGWGSSEGNSVDTLASYGTYIHAADWAVNLATLTSFYVPEFAQTRPPPPPTRASVHTVSFLMTDGDNVQWLLNSFASPVAGWYGSPQRGRVPIGWTVSPALAELAPSLLDLFYSNEKGDNFVAGPSGVGYTIPEKFTSSQRLQEFANLTKVFMDRADLKIVNLIDDTDCDVTCAAPFATAGVDGVFLYEGDAYAGRAGRVTWAGEVPIVGGRYALWKDHTDAVSLARLLRFLPKDPRSAQSYSLIPVHVWTRNVTDVNTAAALLGTLGFDVVTPEVLVNRLKQNVFHTCAAAKPATGPFSSSCHVGADSCGALTNTLCDNGKGNQVTNEFFDHTQCADNAVDNCYGRLTCLGATCECPPAPSGSYTTSCSGCVEGCGLLSGCKCDTTINSFPSSTTTTIPVSDAGGPGSSANPTQVFDYSVCPGSLVANCYGALICQGEPCA